MIRVCTSVSLSVMLDHVFETLDFNDRFQTNGHSKFQTLLTTFNLVLSPESDIYYEWVNHNHTLILITEYNPLTGQHALDNDKPLRVGVSGYTEILCEDSQLLDKIVSDIKSKTPSRYATSSRQF